jgi:hypothetical protein
MRSKTHSDLQDTVLDHFQAIGWIAIKEHSVRGKKVDVLVQNRALKYTIAIEVQLTPKHYKENILSDLSLGCNEVWIVSISKKVSDRIEIKASEELDKELFRKVRFLTKEDLIPHLKQQQIIQNKAEFNAELNLSQKYGRKEVK